MSNKVIYNNIFHMLLYAVDEMRRVDLKWLGKEDCQGLNDLYAYALCSAMSYVLDSGVLQEYSRFSNVTNKPRGRVNIVKSLHSHSYPNGMLSCSYFKLDTDNDLNRVIKLALNILLQQSNVRQHSYLDRGIREISARNIIRLKELVAYLNKVTDIQPNQITLRDIDTSTLDIEYKTAFYIATLVIEEYIMFESDGNQRLINTADESRLNLIFEKFVRNFYHNEYTDGVTTKPSYAVEDSTRRNDLDMLIEISEKALIIDTKWYEGKVGNNHVTNIRQVLDYAISYKEHTRLNKIKERSVSAAILYAQTTENVDYFESEPERRRIANSEEKCKIYTKTLNLNQSFNGITSDLLDLVNTCFAHP